MGSRALRRTTFALAIAGALGLASHETLAQSPTADPRLERWLTRAEAALRQAPTPRSAVRRARRDLERAAAAAPADGRIAWVAGLRLPADPAAAAALEAEAREERATWVLTLLDGLEPSGDQATRRSVERVRGWALAVRGDHEPALETLASTLGVHDEEGADSLRRLAALLIRRGELPLADRALVFAGQAWPNDPVLIAELAAVRVARGAPGSAVRLLGSELRHRPQDPLLREDLAGALLAAGRGAEALRLWRRLASEAEDADDITRLRRAGARAALELGRPETARVEARRALGVRPEDGEARLLLGLALLAQSRPAPARVELLRAQALLGPDLRVERALEALEAAGPPRRPGAEM